MKPETSTETFVADAAPDPLDGLADLLDRSAGAALAQFTNGLSPASLGHALADWWAHLVISPGKQTQLAAKAARKAFRLYHHALNAALSPDSVEPCIRPLPQDHRFDDPGWRHQPFELIQQSFLLWQQWWDATTSGVGGTTTHDESVMNFVVRQMLDTVAPSNFVATNPVVQQRILETGGLCLVDGARNLIDDWTRAIRGERPAGAEAFRPGLEVAATPGAVVYRNELIELIQYTPTTATVRPEPVLIVPAWIMKYYILDLSNHNSLVRWLVGQGYTVFMISWRNPGSDQRHLDLEDYRRLGPVAALDAISAITGARQVHGVGYCLGGTLLAIAAATAARERESRFATLTFFAAQVEFSEPGELGLFIDASQLHFLEDMMWARGYLDVTQMSGAFQMLRSNDLLWSRLIQHYLMGDREPMTDLMAWNSDGTRMPYTMHSQYLRRLFLNDDLAEGRYRVDGRPITLHDLDSPIFAVGTVRDHVAPWHSVHKIHMLTDVEIRFLLVSGGHNAGVVSEPGRDGRSYHVATRPAGTPWLAPDDWLARAERKEGSWWPEWAAWLCEHSGEPVRPHVLGAPDKGYPVLADAPGSYVLQR